MPRRGWGSVTVPGAVGAWAALSERFGRLPFADLLQPAIEIGERGYAVPPIVQGKWAMAAALGELTSQPGFAQAFLPRGRAPEVGELFRFTEAARSLKLIAASKGKVPTEAELAAAEKGAAIPSAYLRVGDRYYGAGNYAKAAALYRQALAKGADANTSNLRLGEALARSGDKAGATAALNAVTGPQADIAKLWLLYAQRPA